MRQLMIIITNNEYDFKEIINDILYLIKNQYKSMKKEENYIDIIINIHDGD